MKAPHYAESISRGDYQLPVQLAVVSRRLIGSKNEAQETGFDVAARALLEIVGLKKLDGGGVATIRERITAMNRSLARRVLASVVVVLACLSVNSAFADVVYIGPRVVRPSGQGAVPTVLTLQERRPPRDNVEQGAVTRGATGDVVTGDAVRGINSKTILFANLTTAEGVASALDLGIFLDIVEPGRDNLVTIQGRNALILTAYKNDGTVLGNFFYTGEFRNLTATAGPGGGRSDHVFGLDSQQAAQLQALIVSNPDLRLGLTSTLGSVSGGPDQFFFSSLGNQ